MPAALPPSGGGAGSRPERLARRSRRGGPLVSLRIPPPAVAAATAAAATATAIVVGAAGGAGGALSHAPAQRAARWVQRLGSNLAAVPSHTQPPAALAAAAALPPSAFRYAAADEAPLPASTPPPPHPPAPQPQPQLRRRRRDAAGLRSAAVARLRGAAVSVAGAAGGASLRLLRSAGFRLDHHRPQAASSPRDGLTLVLSAALPGAPPPRAELSVPLHGFWLFGFGGSEHSSPSPARPAAATPPRSRHAAAGVNGGPSPARRSPLHTGAHAAAACASAPALFSLDLSLAPPPLPRLPAPPPHHAVATLRLRADGYDALLARGALAGLDVPPTPVFGLGASSPQPPPPAAAADAWAQPPPPPATPRALVTVRPAWSAGGGAFPDVVVEATLPRGALGRALFGTSVPEGGCGGGLSRLVLTAGPRGARADAQHAAGWGGGASQAGGDGDGGAGCDDAAAVCLPVRHPRSLLLTASLGRGGGAMAAAAVGCEVALSDETSAAAARPAAAARSAQRWVLRRTVGATATASAPGGLAASAFASLELLKPRRRRPLASPPGAEAAGAAAARRPPLPQPLRATLTGGLARPGCGLDVRAGRWRLRLGLPEAAAGAGGGGGGVLRRLGVTLERDAVSF